MLMNLTKQLCFKPKDPSNAICCWISFGPSFGDCELRAYPPFNEEGKLFSYVGMSCFDIPAKKQIFGSSTNILTGDKLEKDSVGDLCSVSTITEVEVWQII